MSATKGQIISDIELRIFSGKPTDDSELSRRQINFMMDSVRQALMNKKYAMGKLPSYFYKKYTELPLVNGEYVVLPDYVKLTDERGIREVTFGGDTNVLRVRFEERKRPKPSGVPCYYGYYVKDNNMYFTGLSGIMQNNGKVDITLIAGSTLDFADTEIYPMPQEDVQLLIDGVVAMAAQQMGGLFDTDNDGSTETVRPQTQRNS